MSSCPGRGSACSTCPSRGGCGDAVSSCAHGSDGSTCSECASKDSCPSANSCSSRGDACATCPSRASCKSAAGPDPHQLEIERKLSQIGHKILVLSGKGGVGKSTCTAQLSWALGARDLNVGVLDVDICGPSIPKLFNVEDEEIHMANTGWCPVYADDNIAVMSSGFLLDNVDDPIIWRGPKKNGLIQQFLKDVDWGELDYLVIDTPPGTSDEHLSLGTMLKDTGVDGAIIVSTPQEVSLLDVRKEVDFCKRMGIKILGVIENMSMFTCTKCGFKIPIFSPTSGGVKKMCEDLKIPYLGDIPLDPVLTRAADEGKSFLSIADKESPAVAAINNIVSQIVSIVEDKKTDMAIDKK